MGHSRMQPARPFKATGSPAAAHSSYANVVRSGGRAAKGPKAPMATGDQHSHAKAPSVPDLQAKTPAGPLEPAATRLISKLNPEAPPFEPLITRKKTAPAAAPKPSTPGHGQEASTARIRASETELYAAIVHTTSLVAAATAPLVPAGSRSLTFVEVVRA